MTGEGEVILARVVVVRTADVDGGMRDDVTTDDGQGGEIDLPTAIGMLAIAQHSLLTADQDT